ncbi:MAG: hypothetical protein J2P23_08430, partial [Microlunatus sp.]|nr:hypothetical protein [Microlunatus sp.]
DIAASMSQNVADVTHQAASSARNLYASVVREVSQSEHETISTRVVANYNHMHALTMQYYEVVQVYRTSTVLHRFEPCLFVPMKPIDFAAATDAASSTGELIIRRYRSALRAAALDEQTRTLLDTDSGDEPAIEIRPTVQQLLTPGEPATPPATVEPAAGTDQPPVQPANPAAHAAVTVNGSVLEVPDGVSLQSVAASFPCRWGGLDFVTGAQDSTNGHLNPNVGSDGQTFQADLPTPIPLADIAAISLDTNGLVQVGTVRLTLAYQGAPLVVDVPVVVFGVSGGSQVLTVRRNAAAKELLGRLAQDALHYSQAVWRAMDSATISAMLSGYSYAGRPLAQVVDAEPVGVSGNYLIFRMPGEGRDLLAEDPTQQTILGSDAAWRAWITKHADYDTAIEDFVPLPSGGVFAEAVLGRANSAELLDITRFWNWQDSPIPLQPSEIAPVQTDSRATNTDLTPAGFAAPIVTVNNPTPLPDPAGLSAVLGAVSNGNLFRDMSGSAITQALAAAALANAGQGATAAGSQAQAYAALAAQKEIDMAKIAAGLVSGGLAGGGSVSELGARINEGRALDVQAADKAAPGETVNPNEHEVRAAEGEAGTGASLLQEVAAQEAAPTSQGSEAVPQNGPTQDGSVDGPSPSSSSSGGGSSSPVHAGQRAPHKG